MPTIALPKKAFLLLVAAALSASPATICAQSSPPTGTVGLSASIQSGQTSLIVPIWVSSTMVVAPSFGVLIRDASDNEDDRAELGVGISLRNDLRPGKTRPYMAARFGYHYLEPAGRDAQTEYIFGPALGGEYYLDSHFSFGVEAQLNVMVSDREPHNAFDQDRFTVNTATAVMATLYL